MNWHLLSLNTNLKRTNSSHETQRHHEDSVAFQKRFTTDVNCLEKTVISNSFMLEKLTILNNHDKEKFSLPEDIKIIETEGEEQFLRFWEKRPASAELSNNVTIPSNLHSLLENYNKKSAYNPVVTAVMMKNKFLAYHEGKKSKLCITFGDYVIVKFC